jgi:hypothetical protein
MIEYKCPGHNLNDDEDDEEEVKEFGSSGDREYHGDP